MAGRMWLRLLVLCGRAWGVAPGPLRRLGELGEVSLEEAWELYLLEVGLSEGWVVKWMEREKEARREAILKRARRLVAELKVCVDEGRREEISRELEEINGGRSRK